MGAQGLRTTFRKHRGEEARLTNPLLHAQHRCGLRVFRLDQGERTNTNSPAPVMVGRGAKKFHQQSQNMGKNHGNWSLSRWGRSQGVSKIVMG